MYDEPLPEDQDEERSSYEPVGDPISDALGSNGYATPHVLAECVERFDSKVSRFPEKFDRFYWEPVKVLIDIVGDSSPDYELEERARKRCEFKAGWCAEHGYVYLVVPESDSENTVRIREMLVEQTIARNERPAVARAELAGKRSRSKRGQVQRPKATA